MGNSLEDFSHDEEDHHGDDVNSLKVLGKMMPDPDFDVVLPYGEKVTACCYASSNDVSVCAQAH